MQVAALCVVWALVIGGLFVFRCVILVTHRKRRHHSQGKLWAEPPDPPNPPAASLVGKLDASSIQLRWVCWVCWVVMQFVVPGCKEDPPLRAAGAMVHLTYAALYTDELNFEYMLNAAREGCSLTEGDKRMRA